MIQKYELNCQRCQTKYFCKFIVNQELNYHLLYYRIKEPYIGMDTGQDNFLSIFFLWLFG